MARRPPDYFFGKKAAFAVQGGRQWLIRKGRPNPVSLPVLLGSTVATVDIGTATWTLAVPAEAVDGCLLLAILGLSGGHGGHTPPAGWTALPAAGGASPASDAVIVVEYRVASDEPASYNFVFTNANRGVKAMLAFENVHQADPIDAAAYLGVNATTTPSTDTITPSEDGCMVVAAFAYDGASGATFTAGPAGFDVLANATDTGTFAAMLVAGMLQETAAAISVQATSNQSDEHATVIVALAPAS